MKGLRMPLQMSLPLFALGLVACRHTQETALEEIKKALPVVHQRLVVSVKDQMMVTFDRDQPKRLYPVSTSRFGVGNRRGSYKTPLGRLAVVEIVGKGLPAGAKLKAREPTGELVPVDAPGRDPIVTRVLRLRGLEAQNSWAFERAIYIHGTPEESKLKTPASYGCVRMASADIIALCQWVKVGARLDIVKGKLPSPDQLPP